MGGLAEHAPALRAPATVGAWGDWGGGVDGTGVSGGGAGHGGQAEHAPALRAPATVGAWGDWGGGVDGTGVSGGGAGSGGLAEHAPALRAPATVGTWGDWGGGVDGTGVGGGGAGSGGLAEHAPALRAPVRVGQTTDGALGGAGGGFDGAGHGGLAAHAPTLRRPGRIGVATDGALGGAGAGGFDGAGGGGLAEHAPTLRAPARVGRHGFDGGGTLDALASSGATLPPEHVLARALSERPKLVLALGRAFANLVTDAAPGAPGLPPEFIPETLRTVADLPHTLGQTMQLAGLTTFGGGTGGLVDWSDAGATQRADLRAMAVGDIGMALATGVDALGPYAPPEIMDLKPQERDAVTLALGRALLHMVDGAAAAGGGAPTLPAEVYEDPRRAPAVVEAMGRLALQLADDAGGAYVPPEDWAAAQSKDRGLPARATSEWARAVGTHLVGIVSQVEAAGTGGVVKFRDALRADATVVALAGLNGHAEDAGPGTGALADADAARRRRLDQYSLELAARLYGVNANAEELGAGTGGQAVPTRTARAAHDRPLLRGSAPFRVVDGHGGLRLDPGGGVRSARTRNGADRPVSRRAAADDASAQAAAPVRGSTQFRRLARRSNTAPRGSAHTQADHWDGGGQSSAVDRDFADVDSRFAEVET